MNNQTITRRIFGTTTGSTNDLAHIDIPYDAWLTAIILGIAPSAFTTADRVYCEISTSSVGQSATNDALGILGHGELAGVVVTSGSIVGVTIVVAPIRLWIPRGTRIYMHTAQNGSSSTVCRADLHLMT